MKISEHFNNAFFRADDFDRAGRNFIVDFVEVESVGKEEKIVIHFEDEDKTLPVNKTNALTLSELIGDDTDDWIGKEIRIYKDYTMFQNKRVSCMRVGSPTATSAKGTEFPSGEDSGSGSGSGSGSRNTKKGKRGEDAPIS